MPSPPEPARAHMLQGIEATVQWSHEGGSVPTRTCNSSARWRGEVVVICVYGGVIKVIGLPLDWQVRPPTAIPSTDGA